MNKRTNAKAHARRQNLRRVLDHLRDRSESHHGYGQTRRERRAVIRRTDWALTRILQLQSMWSDRLGHHVFPSEAIFLSMFTNEIPDDFYMGVRFVRDYGCPNTRYGHNPAVLLKATRDAYATWQEESESTSLPHLDTLDDGDFRTVDTGDLFHTDDTYYCDACDEYHSDTVDSIEVITGLAGTQTVRSETHCRGSNSSFYCDVSDAHYCDSRYTMSSTSSGDTICHEYADAAGWYWDDDDDVWRDESGSSSSSSIPGYHNGNRSGLRSVLNTMQGSVPATAGDRMFGVEVEVNFDAGYSSMLSWYEQNRDSSACIERDGTLNDMTGVEIISPPLPLTSWQQGNWFTDLIEAARKAGARGWQHRGDHGVHVNCDLRGLSRTECAMFYATVNNLSSVFISVSGRVPWRGGYHKVSRLNAGSDDIMYDMARLTGMSADDKYQACRLNHYADCPMAEVRTFGSNVRPGALREYIELCSSVIEFVREAFASGSERLLGPVGSDGDGTQLVPAMRILNNTHQQYLAFLGERSDYPSISRLLSTIGVLSSADDEVAGDAMDRDEAESAD